MIDFSEFEKVLENNMGDLEPELRHLARIIAGLLNTLNDDLLEQELPEEERRAIQQMVLKALECHMRGLPPPTEEVGFWMQMLDSKIFLPEDSRVQ